MLYRSKQGYIRDIRPKLDKSGDRIARFPDFFLVGAPKSGTTSIYECFGRHPGIFVPKTKEPHFFSCPEAKDTYYEVTFVDAEPDYLELFREADEEQRIGDFSPSYLYYKNAAVRIKERCPDAQILMVLRDPVDRAISHYLMDRRSGYQDHSLKECLLNREDHPRFYREYVEVGEYSEQVERYLRLFGGDNVHIWLFETFASYTEQTVREMLSCLGLEWRKEIMQAGPQNRFQYYKYPIIQKIVMSGWARWFIDLVPQRLKGVVKQVALADDKPDLAAERNILRDMFREEVRELEKLLQRDLSHWLR